MLARSRKDRGVVPVSRLQDHVEKPRCVRGYRETWAPITYNRFPRDVLQDRFAFTCVFQKLLWCHRVNQPVSKAMRSDLMTSVAGLSDKLRKSTSNVAQKKAGHPNICFAKYVQESSEISLHTRGQ